MKRAPIVLAVLLSCLVAAQALAQPADLINARLAVHATSHNLKGASCTDVTRNPNLTGTPCTQYTVDWPTSTGADVYYVLGQAGGPGFTGVTAGIEYSETVGVFGAVLCATLEFPNAGPNGPWPASGGGNVITWGSCNGTQIDPAGYHAVAYVFYLFAYGDGYFKATENRNLQIGSNFEIANCSGQSLSLWNYYDPSVRGLLFGSIGFGSVGGFRTCGVVATQEATWGKIKNLYHNGG